MQPRDELSSRSNDRRQKTSKADGRYCHEQNKHKSKHENKRQSKRESEREQAQNVNIIK